MKKILTLLLAGAVATAASFSLPAADKPAEKAPAKKPEAPAKPDAPATRRAPERYPYRGEVKEINKQAKTFTLGEITYQVSSTTTLEKGPERKPATFDDIKVGEDVRGSYKAGDYKAGEKRPATLVRVGPFPAPVKKDDAPVKKEAPKKDAK